MDRGRQRDARWRPDAPCRSACWLRAKEFCAVPVVIEPNYEEMQRLAALPDDAIGYFPDRLVSGVG